MGIRKKTITPRKVGPIHEQTAKHTDEVHFVRKPGPSCSEV